MMKEFCDICGRIIRSHEGDIERVRADFQKRYKQLGRKRWSVVVEISCDDERWGLCRRCTDHLVDCSYASIRRKRRTLDARKLKARPGPVLRRGNSYMQHR
jgi:hypothetical protein